MDLITVAQALHWFDIDRFFAEAVRVLKPGGVLSFWCYEHCAVDPACDAVIRQIFVDVEPYWPPERDVVENHYEGIEMPIPDIRTEDFSMQAIWTVEEILGYMRTWSASQRYMEDKGADPTLNHADELRAQWGAERRTVRWPITLRVGRKLRRRVGPPFLREFVTRYPTGDALNTATPSKRIGVTVAMAVILSGCAAIQDFLAPLGSGWESTPEVTPIAEQLRLDPISRNYFELTSPEQSVVGEPQIVFTSEENTFSDLAREYGLGFDELVAANPEVDPWLPGADTPILLPTQYVLPDVPREGIVLNIASKRLFYFPGAEEGRPQVVLTYPIGIGRVGWETPLGSSAVIAKARDPSWYVPASVRRENRELGYPDPSVVPPGPDNPLGKFVLKLDLPGYLIHGTNQPYGVGMRVSHGCVRLYPENIELLYELVGLGESVMIINEPFLAGQRDGEFFFEGHTPLEDDEVSGEDHLQKIFASLQSSTEESPIVIDEEQVRAVAAEALGLPVRIQKADTAEVMARARVIRNTVEPDPNMPTLEEVRALLDESIEVDGVGEQVAIDE